LYKDFPYLKRGRIVSDPTTIREKIIPELKLWFPSNRYEMKYDYEYRDGQMIRRPEIYIFSSCTHLKKELENYVYDY
ncbi:MAG: hypothetical protein WC332_02820, partial [Clostridia bacterium]|jgi:hypothetical protein